MTKDRDKKSNSWFLRKEYHNRLKKINDLVYESKFVTDGLSIIIKDIEENEKTEVPIRVPSQAARGSEITRKKEYVVEMLRKRSESGEFVQSLVFAVAVAEDYIAQTLVMILQAYPQKLAIAPKSSDQNEAKRKPSVDLSDLLKFGTLDEFISEFAMSRASEILYASPAQYVEYLSKVTSIEINRNVADRFFEIKATRDIYIHNDGVTNETYLRKAGKNSRAKSGCNLPVNKEYLYESLKCIKDFFEMIHNELDRVHGDSKQLSILIERLYQKEN